MKMLRSKIDTKVKNKIIDIICNSNAIINDKDHFVHDLKICSDDLSFTFIEGLEEELSVYGTQDEWLAVYSVGDAIELLYNLKVDGRTTPPAEPNLRRALKSKLKI